jgi:hypothetical protein
MSVLGKIGLTTNPYKGRVKYYVNWREPNARKAYLKSTFPADRPSPAFAASGSGQVIEVVNAASAVQLPLPLDSPRNGFATTSTQFRLRAHRSQLTPKLTNLMYRSKQALTVSVPVPPRAADPYGHLRPLDARLVDIFSMRAAQEEDWWLSSCSRASAPQRRRCSGLESESRSFTAATLTLKPEL